MHSMTPDALHECRGLLAASACAYDEVMRLRHRTASTDDDPNALGLP